MKDLPYDEDLDIDWSAGVTVGKMSAKEYFEMLNPSPEPTPKIDQALNSIFTWMDSAEENFKVCFEEDLRFDRLDNELVFVGRFIEDRFESLDFFIKTGIINENEFKPHIQLIVYDVACNLVLKSFKKINSKQFKNFEKTGLKLNEELKSLFSYCKTLKFCEKCSGVPNDRTIKIFNEVTGSESYKVLKHDCFSYNNHVLRNSDERFEYSDEFGAEIDLDYEFNLERRPKYNEVEDCWDNFEL